MAEIIAELVAFVLIVFVLYRYVWPPVRRMMEAKQDEVARQVAEAEQAEQELTEARRRYDSAVSDAEQEASRIRDDARADATRIREELSEQAELDVARITQRGEEQLAAERDASVRGLRSEIGGLSMQLAQRIIAESMDDNQKRASVDGFLDDLDGLGSGSTSGAASGRKQPAQAGGGVS